MKKVTRGYMLAIETWAGDSPPNTEVLKHMFQTLLQDHGYDVEIHIESMGEIDCYEPEDDDG